MPYTGRQQRAYEQFFAALRRVVQRASAELPADDVTGTMLGLALRRLEVAHGAATTAAMLNQLAAEARAGTAKAPVAGPVGAAAPAGGHGRP